MEVVPEVILGKEVKVKWGEFTIWRDSIDTDISIYFASESIDDALIADDGNNVFGEGLLYIRGVANPEEVLEKVISTIQGILSDEATQSMENGLDVQFKIRDGLREAGFEIDSHDVDHWANVEP